MNFAILQPFIKKASASKNSRVKKAADSLQDQLVAAQQAEEISQPTLHAQSDNKPLNDKPKDEVDKQIDNWMPDVAKPEDNPSEFGKAAASYSTDIAISSLPKETQADIFKFSPDSKKNNQVV